MTVQFNMDHFQPFDWYKTPKTSQPITWLIITKLNLTTKIHTKS